MAFELHFDEPPRVVKTANWVGFSIFAIALTGVLFFAGIFEPFGDGAREVTLDQMRFYEDRDPTGLSNLTPEEKEENREIILTLIGTYERFIQKRSADIGGYGNDKGDTIRRVNELLLECLKAEWYLTPLMYGCGVVSDYFDGRMPIHYKTMQLRYSMGYRPGQFNHALAAMLPDYFDQSLDIVPVDLISGVSRGSSPRSASDDFRDMTQAFMAACKSGTSKLLFTSEKIVDSVELLLICVSALELNPQLEDEWTTTTADRYNKALIDKAYLSEIP